MAEDSAPMMTEEQAAPEAPDAPAVAAEAPGPFDATTPTYHISIWDTPVTYLCQLCTVTGLDAAGILDHLSTVHSAPAIPTLLAQDYANRSPALQELLMPHPTYRLEDTPDGQRYVCLLCEQAGTGHWSLDEALFRQHQEHRHNGEMILAQPGSPKPEEGEEDVPEPSRPIPPGYPEPEPGDKEPVEATSHESDKPQSGV
jgi:hypothetical protein